VGRLIDADKLNKKRKYSFQVEGGVFSKNEWFIKATDLFDAPTAYDLKAVLKELEGMYLQNSDGVLVAEVRNNTLNEVIEVVKRGGRPKPKQK